MLEIKKNQKRYIIIATIFIGIIILYHDEPKFPFQLSENKKVIEVRSFEENPMIEQNTAYSSANKFLKCEDLVVFSDSLVKKKGLGDQIFLMVAGLLIAQLTDRVLVLNTSHTNNTILETIFTHQYLRITKRCDLYHFDEKKFLSYNQKTEFLNSVQSPKEFKRAIKNKAISINGSFQSWVYRMDDKILREEYMKMNENYTRLVSDFFKTHSEPGWETLTFVRVGVHVMREDVLDKDMVKNGYIIPRASYYFKAMKWFLDKFKRVQFIVVSNDIAWCVEKLLKVEYLHSYGIDVDFSVGNSELEDFSILASCDHTILSTGTFGWWAAYLTNGTVIYYENWLKNGLKLDAHVKKEDFYPPTWIGMSEDTSYDF